MFGKVFIKLFEGFLVFNNTVSAFALTYHRGCRGELEDIFLEIFLTPRFVFRDTVTCTVDVGVRDRPVPTRRW
jgi:hypothetical protein